MEGKSLTEGTGCREFNIVLKETPLDGGLALQDCADMFAALSGPEAVPLEIQAEHSVAMGFINLTDAEFMGYDYSCLEDRVKMVLEDTGLESPDGVYEVPNGHGVSLLRLYR